jgi:hypothetical protein
MALGVFCVAAENPPGAFMVLGTGDWQQLEAPSPASFLHDSLLDEHYPRAMRLLALE